MYIHPNSTQVEASHLERPQRRNSIWPIIVVGIVVFLFSVIKSCSSNNQNDGYSNVGNQQHVYEDNNNIYEDDNNGIIQEPEKELISFAVEEISRDTLNVPGIFVGDTIAVPEEPSVTFSGYSSENEEKQVFTYTAPRDGRYRFDFEEVNANTSIRVIVNDSTGDRILDAYTSGGYATLNANETYEVQVRNSSGESGYILKVGVQKPTIDISTVTTIKDQVSFEDQKNCYTFTASVGGRYRFDLTETNANVGFRLMMWDRLENNIMDNYSEGGYVTLEAGETYSLQVRQDDGLGSYKMVIGCQKIPVDITSYDVITDNLTFDDQKNVYLFTPTYSGTVSFTIGGYNSSCSMRLMAWDEFENNIMDTYNEHGTINVDANKTYEIQVRQDDGYCSYSLYVERQ